MEETGVEQNTKKRKFEPDDTASLSEDSDCSEKRMESKAIEYSDEELEDFVRKLNIIKSYEESEFKENNLDFKKVRKFLKQKRIAKPNSAFTCFTSAECEMLCGQITSARRLILRGSNLCDSSKLIPWATALLLYCRTIKISNPMSDKTPLETAYLAIEDSMNSHDAKDNGYDNVTFLMYTGLRSLNKNDLKKVIIDKFPHDCRLWILLSAVEEKKRESDERSNEIIGQAMLAQADHGEEIDGDKWMDMAYEMIMISKSSNAIFNAVLGVFFKDGKSFKMTLIELLKRAEKDFFTSPSMFLIHLYRHIPYLRNFLIRYMFNDQQLKLVSNSENTEYFSSLFEAYHWWKLVGSYEKAQRYFTRAFALSSEIKDVFCETYIKVSRDRMKREPKLETATILAQDALALNQIDYAMELVNGYKIETNEFWILKGQAEMKKNEVEKAKISFESATRQRGKFITFLAWLFLCEIEENHGNLPRARELLELGKRENSELEIEFDIAFNHLQLRAGNQTVAKDILNRVLQKYCYNDRLWAEAIFMESREDRALKAVEAMRNLKENSKTEYVLLAVANNFFSRGEKTKARKWFNKTVETYPKFFDAWAYYYKFEYLWGTEDRAEGVLRRCVIAKPNCGFKWEYFKNKNIENYWLLKYLAIKYEYYYETFENKSCKILPLFAKSLPIPGAEPEYSQKTERN